MRIPAYISNRFMAKIHSKSMYAVHIRHVCTLRLSYIYARACLIGTWRTLRYSETLYTGQFWSYYRYIICTEYFGDTTSYDSKSRPPGSEANLGLWKGLRRHACTDCRGTPSYWFCIVLIVLLCWFLLYFCFINCNFLLFSSLSFLFVILYCFFYFLLFLTCYFLFLIL